MTVKEIKQELEKLGVEYDNDLKKDELLSLLNEHQKENSYVVVYPRWKDVEDNDKIYKKGDPYDSKGKTAERIAELSSKNNKIGKVLIKETE